MRLGLVVEGSHLYHARTRLDLLEQLWGQEIHRIVGGLNPARVFGISKASVAAMGLRHTQLRRTTSIAEPLDAALERLRKKHDIECFVIAWDLIPPWDKQSGLCRWTETLGMYEGLSLSQALDAQFRDFAAKRFEELRQRGQPSQRAAVPHLVKGAVLAVCMDPVFESVFMNEGAMRKALGIGGKRVPKWPSGWDTSNVRAVDVIAAAVDAARDAAPGNRVFRQIRQGYETLKTDWAIHFLKSRVFDEPLRSHPIGRRLAEVCKTTTKTTKKR